MSQFLHQLAARSLGKMPGVRPRVPALFEPPVFLRNDREPGGILEPFSATDIDRIEDGGLRRSRGEKPLKESVGKSVSERSMQPRLPESADEQSQTSVRPAANDGNGRSGRQEVERKQDLAGRPEHSVRALVSLIERSAIPWGSSQATPESAGNQDFAPPAEPLRVSPATRFGHGSGERAGVESRDPDRGANISFRSSAQPHSLQDAAAQHPTATSAASPFRSRTRSTAPGAQRSHSYAPPAVEVTIGRVEVRAIHAEVPARKAPTPKARPTMSLDDYLKRGSEGRR